MAKTIRDMVREMADDPEPGRSVEEDYKKLLIQGAGLRSSQELLQRAQIHLQQEGEENAWPLGPFRLPHRLLYNHVLYIGSTGSGKTTFINQLKRNTLAKIRHGSGHRACIWDFKSEELQYLAGLGLCDAEGRATGPCKIYYVNPADARGVPLDIARDVTNALKANQFAHDIIAPGTKEGGENAVWIQAARSCVSQVIKTFQETCGTKWQLFDVIEACCDSEKLRVILGLTREGKRTIRDSLGPPKQAMGVFFSIQSFLEGLTPIAAAMANKMMSEPGVSLTDWVRGEESILVIGNTPELKETLAPLQRWIFGHIVRTLLVQKQTQSKRYLFFLDEVRQAPFGNHLAELATTGRSKGAAMAAGLQDKEGLKETLGENNAKEFIGMFDTLVFLKVKTVETQEWASQYFGKHLRTIGEQSEGKSINETSGTSTGKGRNEGRTYREAERTLVYPNEFRDLPSPREEQGHGRVVEAIVSIPFVGEGKVLTGGMVEKGIIPDENVPEYVELENRDMKFEWSETRLKWLGLPQDVHGQLLGEEAEQMTASASAAARQETNGEIDIEELLEDQEDDPDSTQWKTVGPGVRFRGGWV